MNESLALQSIAKSKAAANRAVKSLDIFVSCKQIISGDCALINVSNPFLRTARKPLTFQDIRSEGDFIEVIFCVL